MSNERVVRASQLVDKINIDNAEYNLEEVIINSDLSETNKQPINSQQNLASSTARKSNITDDFDQLCRPYMGIKSTQTVLHKNMIPTSSKLKEVHIDL